MKWIDIVESLSVHCFKVGFAPQQERLEFTTCVSLTCLWNLETIGTWDVAFAFQVEMHCRHYRNLFH